MNAVMVDNLSQLEERVEGLIKRLEQAITVNESLRAKFAAVQNENEKLQEENLDLEEKLESLAKDYEDASGKEEVIRTRLQGILEKIDALENEIQEPQPVE